MDVEGLLALADEESNRRDLTESVHYQHLFREDSNFLR